MLAASDILSDIGLAKPEKGRQRRRECEKNGKPEPVATVWLSRELLIPRAFAKSAG